MKKGICSFFGVNVEKSERVKLIAESGFDHFISSTDKRFFRQNGTLAWQVKEFAKYGILPSSLHFSYSSDELHYFWEKGIKGFFQKKSLIHDLRLAKKFGFSCVVVHLKGNYSKIGEKRLKDVLKYCEKIDVPIAIENIEDVRTFVSVFENIEHPYLKFCCDIGHQNIFDNKYNYLEKYQDKLIAVHLHDNNGEVDMHTLNKYGTINWPMIASYLKHMPNIVLDYELLMIYNPENLDAKTILAETKKQADELEALIEKDTK